jgi:hypothetical protein
MVTVLKGNASDDPDAVAAARTALESLMQRGAGFFRTLSDKMASPRSLPTGRYPRHHDLHAPRVTTPRAVSRP